MNERIPYFVGQDKSDQISHAVIIQTENFNGIRCCYCGARGIKDLKRIRQYLSNLVKVFVLFVWNSFIYYVPVYNYLHIELD